jgi:DNA-binding transcriptional ArsR family regulator
MLNLDTPLNPVFHALADPTRRAIVDRLAQGPASVSDIAAPLPMSLPAVMLHLKVLEESGLVHSEKTGRVRTCWLDVGPLSRAESWINDRRKFLEGQMDRLAAFLESEELDSGDGR